MGPGERRSILTTQMKTLAESSKNCQSCSGLCCTSVKNSMQTTQQETSDLYFYLKETGRITPELIGSLKKCVSDYRLDKFFGDGKRALRKTYTCPFYSPGPKGCSIPPDYKPYGCLAFNPTQAAVTDGSGCQSDQELLLKREQMAGVDKVVHEKFWWEKLPMPVALLEFIKFYGDQTSTKSSNS